LLEIVPESVIASPKMPTLREVAIVTDLAFGVVDPLGFLFTTRTDASPGQKFVIRTNPNAAA